MSKTVNIPNEYPYEEFKRLYMDIYKTGVVKGGTTYRAGTMTEVLGSADKKESKNDGSSITKTNAPARPKTVPCEIHHVTTEGKKWIVLVGLLGEDPYEVFTFKEKSIHLPPKFKTGNLTKVKRGRYDLESDGIVIENIGEHFETDEQEALTRMISTSLRHGADIKFIVEQLNKSEGKITSFAKAIGRTLKKYIPDGEKSTETCPNCNAKNTLVYQEGCVVCTNCASSKCG
jgi:ribonucleoside-diphosphate reductase alpha chain